MLDVLARPDPRDGWALAPTGHEYARDAFGAGTAPPDLRGVRIAYSPTLGYVDYLDSEIARALDAAAATLESLGAIVEARDPGFPDCHDTFMVHWMASARDMLMKLPPARRALVDPGLQAAVDDAARYTLADFLQAQNQRLELSVAMRKLASTHDLLLTPATAVLPFEAGLVSPSPGNDPNRPEGRTAGRFAPFDWTWWTPYSTPFNLSQQPAIVLACGRSSGGLPIALQLVAPHHRESLCIKAAAAYQAATRWHRDKPAC
jgi:aspartyl-tRNA(Asn)/glutamyl-tRNA(Gln) amidotransferase subunit A